MTTEGKTNKEKHPMTAIKRYPEYAPSWWGRYDYLMLVAEAAKRMNKPFKARRFLKKAERFFKKNGGIIITC